MPTLVFWIDVDNTLLNFDDVKKDLDQHMQVELGPRLAERFWSIYEQVRKEKEVVEIPLALARLREQTSLTEMDDETYRHVYSIFENYPYHQALFPSALETLAYLRTIGLTVIVSDGDLFYQSTKIINSNLAETVEGRVLLYVHKQEHLAEMLKLYPANHYALIDDKPAILSDVKAYLGDRLTTVFVKQGKYAAVALPEGFTPDISVEHIGDLRNYPAERFFQTHPQGKIIK